MPIPESSKALFRCLLAYADGRPVRVLDLREELLCGETNLTAIANAAGSMEVAVVRGQCEPDVDPIESPELLSFAYETFLQKGDECGDCIEWIRLDSYLDPE